MTSRIASPLEADFEEKSWHKYGVRYRRAATDLRHSPHCLLLPFPSEVSAPFCMTMSPGSPPRARAAHTPSSRPPPPGRGRDTPPAPRLPAPPAPKPNPPPPRRRRPPPPPQPPPVDLAGRWRLSMGSGGGCVMTLTAPPGAAEGSVAP